MLLSIAQRALQFRLPLLIGTSCLLLSACSVQVANNGGQFERQVTESSEMVIDPDLARASTALHSFLVGELAYNNQDFPDALSNLSKAGKLAASPAPVLHATLADLLLKQGKLRDALAEANKALDAEPTDVELLLLKGGIQETLGDFSAAVETYATVLKIDKKSVEAAYFSAAVSGYMQRYDDGITVLEEFAQSDSDSVPIRYLLGLLYEQPRRLWKGRSTIQSAAKTQFRKSLAAVR